jgi:cytochrome c556
MQRTREILAVALLAAVCCTSAGHAQPNPTLKAFMQVKLDHSQKILEGLVREDFDLIRKHAQEMSLLSLAETWQVLSTPDYVEFSRKFRHAADSLAEAAKKHELEKATQAYTQVTTGCVECHKYVRAVRVAKREK